MSQDIVHYNNNIFAYRGRLSRIAYIIQNSIIMIFAFRFIYYPYLFQTLQNYHFSPEMLQLLKSTPAYESFMETAKSEANPSLLFILIRYLFLIPLRMIDIKRMRDIVDRNLTTMETTLVAVIFSIPFIDFFSTMFLVFIPANRYAKSVYDRDVKQTDLKGAQKEKLQLQNKRMFEEGKISKAEYERNRIKYQ